LIFAVNRDIHLMGTSGPLPLYDELAFLVVDTYYLVIIVQEHDVNTNLVACLCDMHHFGVLAIAGVLFFFGVKLDPIAFFHTILSPL
jgi:hypothetical protein